jgi:release factor glutamine methyltransferase
VRLKELVGFGNDVLKKAEIEESIISAERLMMHIMNIDRTSLILNGNDVVSDDLIENYMKLIDRRATGEPLQYITTRQYFMGLEFIVDKNVLIPRQDTECLVEEILRYVNKKQLDIDSVFDLCTGSGTIGVSLAYYLNEKRSCHVYASDFSPMAISVASKNAKLNKVEESITFLIGDMFEPLDQFMESLIREKTGKKKKNRFDIITCNPPYIPSSELEKLQKEVRDYEPRIALDGGKDGLDFYRVIAKESHKYLYSGGLLALEIGHDQGEKVEKLLGDKFDEIQIKKDLAGKDRVILAKKR